MNNQMTLLIIQVLGIGAVFYFLIIRPQAQARKRAEAMIAAIKKGDEITTAGGIVGKVKDIKDSRLIVESGTSTLVIERARVVRVGDTTAMGLAGS